MATQLSSKKGAQPPFSAHVYCDQTAVCIRISFGTEVGLSLGDTVLDGNPAPLKERGTATHHFSTHVYCGQTVGWIRIPLGTEVGLGRGDIVLYGDPSFLVERGKASPTFQPVSIVAKRSPVSATAELLYTNLP